AEGSGGVDVGGKKGGQALVEAELGGVLDDDAAEFPEQTRGRGVRALEQKPGDDGQQESRGGDGEAACEGLFGKRAPGESCDLEGDLAQRRSATGDGSEQGEEK